MEDIEIRAYPIEKGDLYWITANAIDNTFIKLINDDNIKMIKAEEVKFLETLSTGEAMLREMIEGKKELSGQDAFKLYDTFGFPIDLTKDICSESGVKVDEKAFEVEMEKQKERARNARSDEQSMHKQSKDLLDFVTPSKFFYN